MPKEDEIDRAVQELWDQIYPEGVGYYVECFLLYYKTAFFDGARQAIKAGLVPRSTDREIIRKKFEEANPSLNLDRRGTLGYLHPETRAAFSNFIDGYESS